MLAMRLGLKCGRWDWWNLQDEHTPYQWSLQRAAYAVEPWDGHRDDIRTALAVIAVIQHVGMASVSEQGIDSLFKALVGYLEPQADKVVSPDEAAAMFRGSQ